MDSMSVSSPDLQVRYQKLATEYSKLRAQLTVLKRGILDEQTKSGDLTTLLKEKDVDLRKLEQEMDSLTFRNQQLAVRVSVLQDELEATQQTKSKKGKGKSSTESPVHNSVMNEELQGKIAENARLHNILQENRDTYQNELSELRSELEELKAKIRRHQAKSDTDETSKTTVEKLEADKVRLEISLQTRDKTLKQQNLEVASLSAELSTVRRDMTDKLQEANQIINDNLPFVDSNRKQLNLLNLPIHDQKRQIKAKEVIIKLGDHITSLTSALSDYHTYCEQRLALGNLNTVDRKLSAHLRENAKFLRAIEHSYATFKHDSESGVLLSLETLPGLSIFAEKLKLYSAYLQRILPYQVLSLQEENNQSTCIQNVVDANEELSERFVHFVMVFERLSTYVSLLAGQSRRSCQHSRCWQQRFVLEAFNLLSTLHDTIADLCKSYDLKATSDSEMPTCTEKLRSTNSCLVSCLTSAVTAARQISQVMSNDADELLGSNLQKPKEQHPAVSDFHHRAASYICSIDEEQPDSVPYDDAIRNRDILESSTESSANLTQQLVTSQEKIGKLEQAKEHWKLEYQLLQMKHEKETKKLRDLEEQMQSLSGATTPQTEASSLTGHSRTASSGSGESAGSGAAHVGSTVTTTMLGKMETMLAFPEDSAGHEEEIKAYFKKRIDELVAELQAADSRAVSYRSECTSLHKRFQITEDTRRLQEREVEALRSTLAQVQEELITTTQNYESQLSTMSEHLATMNEKLTAQKDEIDDLRYQLHNKKRGKPK